MDGFPRPPAPIERALLERLLSVDFPGAAELRAQVAVVDVVGGCRCGCPSIDLVVPGDAPRADVPNGLAPSELSVVPETGDSIVLFVRDGVMQMLEYVWTGDTRPSVWPDPGELAL